MRDRRRPRDLLPPAGRACEYWPHDTEIAAPTAGGPTCPRNVGWSPRSLGRARSRCTSGGRRPSPQGSAALPVYVAAAGGGVVVDVDGNSLIDLASGVAVTGIGNARPRSSAGAGRVRRLHPTCFMVAPYAGYVEVCEQLAALTPGDHAKKAALFNSGAEAVENAVRSPATTPAATPSWSSTTPTTDAPT